MITRGVSPLESNAHWWYVALEAIKLISLLIGGYIYSSKATILWTIPLLLVIFISMYAVSYFGQKKGHNQVEEIYDYMSTIISIHN